MAKREGDVAASAATSAEGRRLLITKRTHCSHLHFRGAFSGHKNDLIFGRKTCRFFWGGYSAAFFVELPRVEASSGIGVAVWNSK